LFNNKRSVGDDGHRLLSGNYIIVLLVALPLHETPLPLDDLEKV
jgi:hypothetical protein